jgi:uncharacterized protein YqeY
MNMRSSLKERLTEDMKTAMRARDAGRLGALRLLLAAIKQKEVDGRIELDDAQVVAIVHQLIKQRRDAATQFEQAGRLDLVAQECAEIEVLSAYRPAQADVEEVERLIAAAIAEAQAAGPRDMGKVMALLKPRLTGRADWAQVSARVQSRLTVR